MPDRRLRQRFPVGGFMAIFSLNHAFVSRGAGHNVIAGAAYLARESLVDRMGRVFDFQKLGGLLHSEIATPTGAPDWAKDRQRLWQTIDARENYSTRAKDARLAHTFKIALPHELTLEQNIWLLRDFVRGEFTRKGYIVDWAIHEAPEGGDSRNIHAHLQVTMRPLEAGGKLGKKWRVSIRGGYADQLKTWRTSWAKQTNRHLKRHGHTVKVDERTLKAQGVDRQAGKHMGREAAWIERKGNVSLRGTLNRIKARKSGTVGGSTGGGSSGDGSGGGAGQVASAFKFAAPETVKQSTTPMTEKPAAHSGTERRRRSVWVATEKRGLKKPPTFPPPKP